ncbi:MAG: HPr family phosphocarrier protein [Caulobacteraceae bacterium]
MKEARLVLSNELGLHARPAAMFAKTAAKYNSSITLKGKNRSANAKSLLAIMSLGLEKGDEMTVSAEGPDEEECINSLKALVENNFDKA